MLVLPERVKWYASGSIQGVGIKNPFHWKVLDNKMQLRGSSRLVKQEQSDKPANDIGSGKVAKKRKGEPSRDASVGVALRSVYSQTVDEAIPSEFLDLLNKLD